MQLGSQKSDAYRSLRRPLLVGCNSSGRSGCGSSGRPRACPPSAMGVSALRQRGHEDAGASYIGGREEEGAMACGGNNDLQLLRISREAHKLNQMIDSWSRSPSFDGRSTGIAADLLRGALDLQESLVMLAKLQEASNFVAETRRKQSYDISEEEEIREMGAGLMGSGRFGSSICQETLQAQRNPDDGSSRNCREELKKVIKGSLYRQNLVPISSEDEEASSGRSLKLPLRNEFGDAGGEVRHKTQCSGSAAAGQKKAKSPNLIARLMGLEEAPSKEFQPAVRSKPERKKNSVQPKHLFDIDMPKVGNPPSPEEMPEPETKTLQEIIEAMQFKGLLTADRSEEPRAGLQVERYFRWLPTEGEAPPIVIIKPMRSASMKVGKAQNGLFVEANHASMQEKGQFSTAMEEAAEPKSILPKEMEERVERSVAKVEAPYKNKISASSHLKQLKETNRPRRKADELQKPVPDRGRLENRSVRSVTVSASQTKATLSTPIRKPESRRPAQVKNPVPTPTSSSNHEGHRSTRPATRKPIDTAKGRRTTKARPSKEPTVSIQVDSPNSKEENKEIIPAQEKTIPAISSTLLSNLLPKEREPNSIISKRDTVKDSSFHCEVMPKRSHGVGGHSLLSHAPEQDNMSLIKVPAESAGELKRFLLSSPSFLLHAQELFNVHHLHPADCHRTETKQIGSGGSKLLLDCSTELLASRSHRFELLNHPLWFSPLKHAETNVSINQLVDEISEEIENLRGYSKGGGDVKDGLYGKLERDLNCNRVFAHAVWDWGWTEVVPIEEADGTVCDVVKLVLDAVIEETAVELSN